MKKKNIFFCWFSIFPDLPVFCQKAFFCHLLKCPFPCILTRFFYACFCLRLSACVGKILLSNTFVHFPTSWRAETFSGAIQYHYHNTYNILVFSVRSVSRRFTIISFKANWKFRGCFKSNGNWKFKLIAATLPNVYSLHWEISLKRE